MQAPRPIPFWTQAPFLRLLPPWIAGTLLQWYAGTGYVYPLFALGCFTAAYSIFHLLPAAWQFQWHNLRGILLQLLIGAAAMLITWAKDQRNHPGWWGDIYREGDIMRVTVASVPEEKDRSFKVAGQLNALIRNDSLINCTGGLVLYLDKMDPRASRLRYGDELLLNRPPQRIRNSGNPGAFNYTQYAAFQGWYHQVYLPTGSWHVTGQWKGNRFRSWLFETRDRVLHLLRKYIPGAQEAGIAEALLIGYTHHLDKDLVQAYSNTGVVHIIAISGMHLGLIYGLLYWLFTRLPLIRKCRWLQGLLILAALWIFALLAGGSASVIRSAVMFSFLTAGRFLFNRRSTFNALAGSAFIMLAYHPYYLWDIGFQLSYTAVTGILLFQQPLCHLLDIPYKIPDLIWQGLCITLAAQVLTFPLCIYYFHQFPVAFLFSNLVAVPLSTLVLYTCIVLLLCSWQPYLALHTGQLISWLLRLLNRFILWMNEWPLAVWDRLPASLLTTLFLFATVILCAAWLMQRKPPLLKAALGALILFSGTHAVEAWQAVQQQRIIIYNIPRQQAIDFVQGNLYRFVGDSIRDERFHLRPARIALRLHHPMRQLPGLQEYGSAFQLVKRRLVIVEQLPDGNPPEQPVRADYILLSRYPDVEIETLLRYYRFRWIVIDATNPLWKIEQWKQDCERLHLQCHPVTEKGAFLSD